MYIAMYITISMIVPQEDHRGRRYIRLGDKKVRLDYDDEERSLSPKRGRGSFNHDDDPKAAAAKAQVAGLGFSHGSLLYT